MGLKQLLLGKFNIWFDHSPIEKNAQGRKDGTDKNQVEAQIVEHLQEFMFIKLTFKKKYLQNFTKSPTFLDPKSLSRNGKRKMERMMRGSELNPSALPMSFGVKSRPSEKNHIPCGTI